MGQTLKNVNQKVKLYVVCILVAVAAVAVSAAPAPQETGASQTKIDLLPN